MIIIQYDLTEMVSIFKNEVGQIRGWSFGKVFHISLTKVICCGTYQKFLN